MEQSRPLSAEIAMSGTPRPVSVMEATLAAPAMARPAVSQPASGEPIGCTLSGDGSKSSVMNVPNHARIGWQQSDKNGEKHRGAMGVQDCYIVVATIPCEAQDGA